MTVDLDLDALLDAARRAAAAGAAIVLDAFGDASNVRTKGPGDWVSDADTSSERAIRDLLHDAAPELAFFGEETGGDRAADVGWFVDPLDGTANFVHGFPVVGVSVALVADGSPVVGVVHAPMLGRVYAARLGGGATCNGEPIRVSDRDPEEAICATGFPFRAKRDRLPEYFPVFERALLDLRGPPPGGCGQPRPLLDRRRGARRLLRAGPGHLGRGRRRACWCGRPGEWSPTGRATTGPGSSRATSWPARAPVHERILEVIAGPR